MRIQAASLADAAVLIGTGFGALVMVGVRRVRPTAPVAPVAPVQAEPGEG